MKISLTFDDPSFVFGHLSIERDKLTETDFLTLYKVAATVQETFGPLCVRVVGVPFVKADDRGVRSETAPNGKPSKNLIQTIKILREIYPGLSLANGKSYVEAIAVGGTMDFPVADMATNERRCEQLKAAGFSVTIVQAPVPAKP